MDSRWKRKRHSLSSLEDKLIFAAQISRFLMAEEFIISIIFFCFFCILCSKDHHHYYYATAPIKWAPVSIRLSVCRVSQSNSRTERPMKLKIGRMKAHHTSNRWNYSEVKRSKIKSPGRLMLKAKVCCLRTSNLVGAIMRYQQPWPAIKACEVGLLHAGGAYRVGRTRRPHNLSFLF